MKIYFMLNGEFIVGTGPAAMKPFEVKAVRPTTCGLKLIFTDM